MTNPAHNGGPAFPRDNFETGVKGMSLRQWYAGQALPTCLAEIARIPAPEGWTHEQTAALMAFRSADAMLAEEQTPDPVRDAAHDLLNALKLAAEQLEDMDGYAADARAAIAKAEGRDV